MSTIHAQPAVIDWELTIERARSGAFAEDKLARTIQLLVSAQQRARLRGDQRQVGELASRLEHVHQLLDLL